jgi:diguanylate cyclase (GGDEF)-like protein
MLRSNRVLLSPLVVCLLDFRLTNRTLQTFAVAAIAIMAVAGVVAFALRLRRLKIAERLLMLRLTEMSAELAAANRRLELRASTDELTQLPNRRRFVEFLEQEWLRAEREPCSVALLMIDVDFFKRYNDRHGHQAGDDCLRRVAAVIAARVKRTSDLAARYGGEEFAVVLSGADEDGARGVAEWIRAEIESQQIPHGGSSVSDFVTVSVGVSVAAPCLGARVDSLVGAADAALYRAKELGRNAIIAASAMAAAGPA